MKKDDIKPHDIPMYEFWRGFRYGAILGIGLLILSFLMTPKADALTFSPTGPEISGYLDTHNITQTMTNDNEYVKMEFADGTVCGWTFRILNSDTLHFGPSGPFGSTNWASYVPAYCDAVPDFTIDGDYITSVYSDSSFTALLETGTFCQGSGCAGGGGGGGGSTSNDATSTQDQVHENIISGFWIFFAIMAFITWLFRSQKV